MYIRSSYSSVATINTGHVKPSMPGTSGKFASSENSLFFGLGIPPPPVQGFTISKSSLRFLPLVSSNVLTPLVCYVPELHAHNLKIAQMYCAIPRSAVISRLARSFRILRMHSAISNLHTFLDCAEHIYGGGCHLVATYWHCWCEFS